MKTLGDSVRCEWCLGNDLYIQYHDKDWGTPLHDDQKLFELLSLEGAQAGLSWLTVLKKREGYRKAFKSFDIKKVAAFNDSDIVKLLNNPDIIRNKLKVNSVIRNAKVILEIQKEVGSFDKYLWDFVNGKTVQHHIKNFSELPSINGTAVLISRDLRKRGCNFVGPRICYAFMQSSGMINDHIKGCFRYDQLV
jgi:DNA-3-methyladenine glycosylase I